MPATRFPFSTCASSAHPLRNTHVLSLACLLMACQQLLSGHALQSSTQAPPGWYILPPDLFYGPLLTPTKPYHPCLKRYTNRCADQLGSYEANTPRRLLLYRNPVPLSCLHARIQVLADTLYDSDELPMPGAAMRDVTIELRTETGQLRTLSAARRRRPAQEEAARGSKGAQACSECERGSRAKTG